MNLNLYQARNGKIFIRNGTKSAVLSKQQIRDLHLTIADLSELDDFDFDDYKQAYSSPCKDCGLPYQEFGIDTTLPDEQWLMIHPEGLGGLLCANCIVKRASQLQGIIAARMILAGPNKPRSELDLIFGDFYKFLDAIAIEMEDTLWYSLGETAHEALIGLAQKYDGEIAERLQKRLERDCDFTSS